MKTILNILACAIFAFAVLPAQAQVPAAPEGAEKKEAADANDEQAERDAERDRRRNEWARSQNPLLRVLDADADGKLSKEEIENASKALLELDKDKDEELSAAEMRPPTMAEQFATRIKGYDKDGDGKITTEEFPEQMRRMVPRLDTNQDGAVDEKELAAMTERWGAWGRGGGGGGGFDWRNRGRDGGDRARGQGGGGDRRGGDNDRRGGDNDKPRQVDPNI
jgi:Ca2+-binding EF-hand superfamily protein